MKEASRRSLLAFRLAWRQLSVHRSRLVTASLGVAFACFLVFMQIGFRDSLYASVELLPRNLNGDLFVLHSQTEALWRTTYFSRIELSRAFALPEVQAAVPVYLGFAQFKNPDTLRKRTIMVWGYDPQFPALTFPGLETQKEVLSQERTALFDELSRPEYGDISERIRRNQHDVEINDTRMELWGTFRLGASFSTEGNLVTSNWNFLRIFSARNSSQVDIGLIALADGADTVRIQQALRQLLSGNVQVLTRQELIAREVDYWRSSAPIGFVFGLGAALGLVVGMVLTYQVLFTDIANNLKEYATLRAMGYRFGYLAMFVVATSIYLAVIGFIPGLLLSYALYIISESIIYIPMPMSAGKIAMVFMYVLAMCVLSGIFAMSKLKSTNPADMF